ncbi:hypothetical protein INR49_017440 [Caranx melampygus]|nr:hypothetical protein INR49_017440 [Caranx melampygus]
MNFLFPVCNLDQAHSTKTNRKNELCFLEVVSMSMSRDRTFSSSGETTEMWLRLKKLDFGPFLMKSLDSERQPKNRTLPKEQTDKEEASHYQRSDMMWPDKNSFTEQRSQTVLSCMADLNGATPVPGPTMMTGVSLSEGNLRVPFFTHRGTHTSPATPFKNTPMLNVWMLYLERGGDREGARLDLREKIQEVVHSELRCGVGEICQDLQR